MTNFGGNVLPVISGSGPRAAAYWLQVIVAAHFFKHGPKNIQNIDKPKYDKLSRGSKSKGFCNWQKAEFYHSLL